MIQALLRHPFTAFVAVVLLYLLAVPVDIMEVDSAQYYAMSHEMLERGNWLEFTDRAKPYLDKPPLIFWITGLFFSILGESELAFKLPSILFSILGIYATYRLARLFYARETAVFAALMLATTQGYYHFNNDVRTDTYLTNSVIAACWMLAEFLYGQRKSFWWLGGFAFIGLAMLAKGPMGLVAPVAAFGVHILLKREWRSLFRWQWLAGLLVVAAVLSPMLWGLYTQFDMHPELEVNAKTGVSGLRFYFWEQSFGRITGENVWKNDTGPFFFVHNLAWSFLPWTLLLSGALFQRLKSAWNKGYNAVHDYTEWISLGGFLLPFIALSMSKYKLPHYIYVTFPFGAILSASYFEWLCREASEKVQAGFRIALTGVLTACWIFGALIFGWMFPLKNPILLAVALLGLFLFVRYARNAKASFFGRFMGMALSASLTMNVLMAAQFYPSVLEYQSSAHVGKYVKAQGIPTDRLFVFECNGRALDVYTGAVQREINLQGLVDQMKDRTSGAPLLVYTQREGRETLDRAGIRYVQRYERPHYAVTLLTMNFGNPATRESVLNRGYLLELFPQ